MLGMAYRVSKKLGSISGNRRRKDDASRPNALNPTLSWSPYWTPPISGKLQTGILSRCVGNRCGDQLPDCLGYPGSGFGFRVYWQ